MPIPFYVMEMPDPLHKTNYFIFKETKSKYLEC